MRRLVKGAGIAAAAAMMTTTTAASAATPVVAAAPASETVAQGNALHSGVGGATLINIGILAALVVIVLVATRDSGSNDRPNSP